MEINLQVENQNENNVKLAVFIDGANCGSLRLLRPEFGKLIQVIHKGKAPEDVFAVSGLSGNEKIENHAFWGPLLEVEPERYTEYDPWREWR